MYRIGHRAKLKRKRATLIRLSIGLAILVLIGLVGLLAVPYIKKLIHPVSTITQSKAVVHSVGQTSATLHTYNEGLFTIGLPVNWQPTTSEKQPYDIYRWQLADKNTASQQLEIYVDTIPPNFAVNRVLAVQSNGNQITTLGTVSDSCADFTKSPTSPAPAATLAKWQGINFLCDINNYERNVVGTSSSSGINNVIVGPTGNSHKFFFVYTDNTITPDYSVFYNALSSFQLK